jgi:hypothetical protein
MITKPSSEKRELALAAKATPPLYLKRVYAGEEKDTNQSPTP